MVLLDLYVVSFHVEGVVGGPDLGVEGAMFSGLGVMGLIVFAPPTVVVCLTGGIAVVVVVVVNSQGQIGMLPENKRQHIFYTA